MTHVHIPGLNPMWMWAAQLECLVDRNRGGIAWEQWHQQRGSTHVVGINLHVFNLKDAYQENNVGLFKVHRPSIQYGLQLCRGFDELQSAMHYQRLCREST